MIPRIQKAGSSFVGAGRYYLHDKLKEGDKERSRDRETQTDERVWFTDTRNLMATDPERGFIEMWKTAEDQQWLKRQAGGKTCGRLCEEPVKTLSLAWHKDDAPSPEHMVETADAFMKHMGWQEHQAVYIGHRDTEHLHIHIILNRVHPETGKTLDDFREYKRAQEWALAYEKEHENVRCVERELRAAEREHRAPDFGKDDERTRNPPQPDPANEHLPHNVVMLARPHERAFESEEQQRADLFAAERGELKAEQRAEREAWFKDGKQLFKETRHAVYDEVRKDYAGEWRQYYADAKAAEHEADAWSKNAVSRALYFAKEGRWNEMHSAYGELDSVREHIDKELALRKADLIERQNEELRSRQKEACDLLRQTRETDYKQLLQRQRDERAAMKAAHVQERSADFVIEARHQRGEAERQAGEAAEKAANENVIARGDNNAAPSPDKATTSPEIHFENAGPVSHHAADIARDQPSTLLGDTGIAPEPSPEREPRRGLSDLAAGAIGSAAGYIADQLGELFAPTPPEVREAEAKEQAKREAEKPAAPEIPAPDPWQAHIEAALRETERIREEQRSRDYWEERDKGKDWERDR